MRAAWIRPRCRASLTRGLRPAAYRTRAVEVEIRLEYRKLGATSWSRLHSSDGGRFTLIGERPGTMRWEVDLRDELTFRTLEGESGAATALEEFARDAYPRHARLLPRIGTARRGRDQLRLRHRDPARGLSFPGTALLAPQGSPGPFLEWGKSPSGIQGSFWNEALNHEPDDLLHPVNGLPEGTPTNVRAVDLGGVTRETEAARMLRHLAEQARALPFPCSWEARPAIQHVAAGDIVTIKTRVPFSTGSRAMELRVRVLAGIVGRDDDGKIMDRWAGRVMRASSYTLQPVTVPVSSAGTTAARGGTPTRRRRARRRVSGLRARVSRWRSRASGAPRHDRLI